MKNSGLILDTSSSFTFVALSKEGVLHFTLPLLEGRALSTLLLPAVDSICKENSLDYVAIGIGPGSFTGTRMGAIIAKTLAFSLNIPLISFSSSLLPNVEEIALICYEKFQNKAFENQIELVYFSKTP